MGIIYRDWPSKPPPGTPLNPANMIAQNAAIFLPLNEGGGPTVNDLVSGMQLTASGYGTANPWGSGFGPGIICGYNTGFASAGLPSALASLLNSYPVTLACGFRLLGSISGTNPMVAGVIQTSGSSALGQFYLSSSATLRAQCGINLALSTSLVPGVDHVAAITVPSSNGTAIGYLDGVAVASGSVGGFNPSVTTASIVAVGSPATARNANALVYWFAVIPTSLSAGQIAALAANPYRLHAPQRIVTSAVRRRRPRWFSGLSRHRSRRP